MGKQQVKKCDRKPGEKWTDGCCSSNSAEDFETEKFEDSITHPAIESSFLPESETHKH
ncbi:MULTISPECIES: hypothetical protein [Nostocales]|uniref:Uncharacterized protein n=3 Tax=Nostocales TaxID=1161 RepID=A0A8S9T114_9CYAN|nr:hypothetical protein [Tolypothrix bouteillei]KAF3885394.1 hypothetical protein DA73_0400007925 [Tolypothrix bouteillei VB521301]